MGGLSLRQAQARGSTQERFEDRKASAAEPRRRGAIDLAAADVVSWAGIVDPAWVFVQPFGTGPPGSRMSFRLWGWNAVDDRERLYVPTPLVEAVAALETDGGQIQPGARLARSISGNGVRDGQMQTVLVFDSALVVNVLACRWIEFEFAKPAGSTVESMNAFWKPVRQ